MLQPELQLIQHGRRNGRRLHLCWLLRSEPQQMLQSELQLTQHGRRDDRRLHLC